MSDFFDNEPLVVGTFKRWSASAVECLVRDKRLGDTKCDGCYYQKFFESRPYGCKMYLAVEQLLETNGLPSQNMLARHS